MLKTSLGVKELERQAAEALKALIGQVPAVELRGIKGSAAERDNGIDFLADLNASGRHHTLACQVKVHSQPRIVRTALFQLLGQRERFGRDTTPILMAPYLSPEAQALCREHGVGFLDLEGNARIVFDGVFIERIVPNKPAAERRELKSLFKPKSAQVLRVLLRDPSRAWRVTDLAAATDVSLGHVSNVRTALLDREFARVSGEGLYLSEPDALLDAWRDTYELVTGTRQGFYTVLHGVAFEDAARRILGDGQKDGTALFASFSAANWLAPFGRTGTQYFYADEAGLERLRAGLKLAPATKGENVVIVLPKDEGLFRDAVEPAPGAVCTGPVQTYLDLAVSGERGEEAAEHLRRERLTWKK